VNNEQMLLVYVQFNTSLTFMKQTCIYLKFEHVCYMRSGQVLILLLKYGPNYC
jgi:hypothetical protein